MDRNSNSRTRIEEIRKRRDKRERARRRKMFMIRRVVLLLILVGLVLLMILGVRSCVSSIAEHREERAQEQETMAPDEQGLSGVSGSTQSGGLTKADIQQSFYAKSAIIGNSFAERMKSYGLIDGADYFSKEDMSVENAASVMNGDELMFDALGDKDYNKIFMIFGETELNSLSADEFKEKYQELIRTVRMYQPDAQIYLLSMTPVSREVADAENGIAVDSIVGFNRSIRITAQNMNVNFADIYSRMADDEGYLPDGAASDGVHFGEQGYIDCLIGIQEAFGRTSASVNNTNNENA